MTRRITFTLLGTVALIVIFAPLPVRPIAPQERMLRPGSAQAFRVEARQFAYSPSELKVNPGDIVTIQLVSMDVTHGLYVDGYDISVEADPGQTKTLSFVADKPGSFRFRCNVTCGAMHPFMIGKLTVGLNQWLYRSIGLSIIAAISLFFIRSTRPSDRQLPITIY